MKSKVESRKSKVEKVEDSARLHDVVAVRTPRRLVLSVDGGEPENEIRGPFLSLDTPQRLVVGAGLKEGEAIESLEVGSGWPHELPKAPTREDLFK